MSIACWRPLAGEGFLWRAAGFAVAFDFDFEVDFNFNFKGVSPLAAPADAAG
jgi:hypothetical protein